MMPRGMRGSSISLPLRLIEEGHRVGFPVFDGDLDGTLGGFEKLACAAASGEALFNDCGDLPGHFGHGVGHGDGQQVAFAETRVLRSLLTPFQNGLHRGGPEEYHQCFR